MTDTYAATILADSISPDGVRLTTLQVTFPRFILAEVNTHRMLSRNSNSSRAIPPERQIEKVRTNPFVPETFNKRVKGMGVGEALGAEDAAAARDIWLAHSQMACNAAELLVGMDCDKSRINRLLEPFLWHTAIISATEWENFFALRCHPAAQPEFRIVAELVRSCMDANEPQPLQYGQWHLPGVNAYEMWPEKMDIAPPFPMPPIGGWGFWKKVSAGRLARWTSYDVTSEETPEVSMTRAESLISSFHLSPCEHQARPLHPFDDEDSDRMLCGYSDSEVTGAHAEGVFVLNFRGWVQYRAEIPNQSNAALAQSLA